MSHWIDTHAHIYAEEFDADRHDVIERAMNEGVSSIFMPNVDHTTIDRMLEVESRWPGCAAMMGLHPCSVKKDFQRELYTVEGWLTKRTFSAIGEIGTDLYWDKTFWDQQCEAFTIQVNWAKEYKLPVVIHCRESMDETIAMVENLQDGNLSGIFHCFTGTAEQAEKIMKAGFYLGIGGVSTFKKGGLDIVLPDVPTDRIVLETDSPYLAPVPHRGKRNEPSYIPLIAKRVAEIKEISMDELRERSSANAERIFDRLSASPYTPSA
ncbi:MAG: TatD family hydrolase [Bacteroidota bacterium]|nr:TatD family hydrolase [Bacteroidota bacterium]